MQLIAAAAVMALLVCALPVAGAAGLVAGPMPGYPAMRQAVVWLQADGDARAALAWWPEDGSGERRETAPVPLTAAMDFSTSIAVTGLEPGRRYAYQVLLDGEPVAGPDGLRFHTPPLWQWRRDPPPFTVALGSCAYINEPDYDRPGTPYGSGFGLFDRIATEAPEMMLWLGDNIYLREGDFDSPWGMAHRYRHMRRFAPLQRLLRATHHVAIWDDHDFGPNNSNRSFIFREQSLALFRRYWPNPSSGTAALPGIQTVVGYADADFFLLDGRWYRDADEAPDSPDKQLYGEAQLRWLRNALLASTARFKFIAGGSQFLSSEGIHEGWHHFPGERQRFLDWLAQSKVDGVVFLSGDRHATELMRMEREGAYPLHELTCSPLTSGARPAGQAEPSRYRVQDSFVGAHNYCLLGFEGPRTARRLSITVKGRDGQVYWTRDLPAAALRVDGR